MGIQWYIYILIYIHINSEAFWMWPVTNKKRVPQWHGKTWSLSSVCSLWAASGVKSETTPGPRLSQRKKNILLEFLTTINPKKSGSETLKITRSEQNCVTTCSQQIDAMGLPSIRIASTYWCLVNYILFFKMLCFIFGKQLFNPELWLQPLGC